MFKNYFKIALRQLAKQKMYAAIKVGGFALSIASCLLIALFIRDEVSYDKYPNADRIYRIVVEMNNNGKIIKESSMPAPIAKVLAADFPEIEKSGRLMKSPLFDGAGSNEVKREGDVQNTFEEGFVYADQSILDILSIPMVYGDRATALAEPNTVVISRRKAEKYFPNQNPVGKLLVLNNNKSQSYRIGGVMQDPPSTSHLQYDFLLTLTGHELWQGEQSTWMASNYDNYMLLRNGTNVAQLEKKISDDVVKNYMTPAFRQSGNKYAIELVKSFIIHLQPIRDIHLKSFDISDELSHGDIRYVWLFGSVAAFILIIACINFVNLSTAKSANRAKEVGLRKVVGSQRLELIKQFLIESMLYSFLSFVLGILLAALLLPYFNTLCGKSLLFPWQDWWLLPIIVAGALIIGMVAGLYPSFYLSSFKPIQVLKGHVSTGSKNSTLRGVLVVFQFTASIVLIISTTIIYRQMDFILNTKVGYDKEQVLLIQGTNTLNQEVKTFKNELLKLPRVKNVSVSDYLPITGTKRNGNPFWNEGKTTVESSVSGQLWIVDDDYFKTFGMKIVSGRSFSFDIASDSLAVVINQTMASKLNLKDPVGKRITNGGTPFNIVGVVEDFNFESLKGNIQPLCLQPGNSSSIVSVKVESTDMSGVIRSVTNVWKQFVPGQPIRFSFLDESYAKMYDDVQRTARIFGTFSALAIIIACLGLFALSTFMAEQRTREIGIRKVLGASVQQVTALLSKDFIKLVAIAFVIAAPFSWWAMTKWLQDFAYRIHITWDIIAISAITILLIALSTICYQAIKAAIANPVKNLRTE